MVVNHWLGSNQRFCKRHSGIECISPKDPAAVVVDTLIGLGGPNLDDMRAIVAGNDQGVDFVAFDLGYLRVAHVRSIHAKDELRKTNLEACINKAP